MAPTGIVLFGVGDVGTAPSSDLATSSECHAPPLRFLGEVQVSDQHKDYSCWNIRLGSLSNTSDDPLYATLRKKLPKDAFAATFDAVDSVKKKNGRIAHVSIWLAPSMLRSRASRASTSGAPEDILIEDSGSLPGTGLAALMLLREWAIRWQDHVRLAFDDRRAAAAREPAMALPRLPDERDLVPMMPDMGIRVDDFFSHTVQVGPYLVPLPPGRWQAAIHNPQLGQSGRVKIDQVTLLNVQDGKLLGVVQLEARYLQTNQKTGLRPSQQVCAQQVAPNLATYRGPDDYCAIMNWLRIRKDDDKSPLYAELQSRGIAAPASLVGSVFYFSNQLIHLRVFVTFSPWHVGIRDTAAQDQGRVPPDWVSLVPKWRRWTTQWSQAIEAGLTGTLPSGPLPDKWRMLDLGGQKGR